MKNTFLPILCMVIAVFCMQCRKDNITVEPPVINNFVDQTNVDFLIQVSDENQAAVEAATLTINESGISFQSDENGLILVKNQTVKGYGIPVTISKSGFMDQIAILRGNSNSNQLVKLKLLETQSVITLALGTSGNIAGGGTISLPSEIIDANNNPYSGDVVVESYYFNPDQNNFLQTAPAALLAVGDDNELRALASYGMYAINLKDQSGNDLQIANGATAQIEFPIANIHQGNTPSSIPLWSLNEFSGLWEQEGEAQLNGNKVIAEVSHFSFWNLDATFTPVDLCMTLTDINGQALSNAEYLISSSDQRFNYSFGTTDGEGMICRLLPQNEEFIIRLVDGFNIVSPPAGIAAQSASNDLGQITVDVAPRHYVGTAVDCQGAIITDATVQFLQGSSAKFVNTDDNGQFRIFSLLNDEVRVKLYDRTNTTLASDEIIVTPGSSNTEDLGNITVCTMNQGGATIIVDEDIDTDATWSTGNTYILTGIVSVKNNATLTIEPGVLVKGTSDNNGTAAALVITREGTIDAEGTASQPIIFTSALDNIEPGEIVSTNLNATDVALWAGVYILGSAPVSAVISPISVEFLPNDPMFEYGGNDPADGSGTFKYVSIRHTGSEIVQDEETNGLTLAGVGTGTSVEHIEIYAVQDDGIEVLGGTVNVNDILVWYAYDDGFDIDNGWAGTLDNFIYISSDKSSNVIEADGGDGTLNPNFTLTNGSCKGQEGSYIDYRRNAKCLIQNTYFFNFTETSIVELSNDAIAANWLDGSIDVAGLEFNTSHLSGGNNTIEKIFVDGGSDADEAFTTRPPNATIVNTPSVGANKVNFASWSLADNTGALNDF